MAAWGIFVGVEIEGPGKGERRVLGLTRFLVSEKFKVAQRRWGRNHMFWLHSSCIVFWSSSFLYVFLLQLALL